MLKLINIKKVYKAGDNCVTALNGINLEFSDKGFVSILGPSGCGKTTLLNIIGGLDKYTDGDLIINGISTKMYKDKNWDAYRNSSIGFVFQSYNLISHLTVLENVELALTIGGVHAKKRKEMSKIALEKVGLENQLNKRPNQLSGGQMQRVAIARALVNNPDIILADEPTGALDSETSEQIMELLKKIAEEKLVIMVTHNGALADEYSSRIINFLDGKVVSDEGKSTVNKITAKKKSNIKGADSEKIKEKQVLAKDISDESSETKVGVNKKKEKTSMSFWTAIKLSFKNLLTKKGRTFLTGFAGSIGIIGIALVLSLSNGLSLYISNLQTDTLSQAPITISKTVIKVEDMMNGNGREDKNVLTEFPKGLNGVYPYEPLTMEKLTKKNKISDEYEEYIRKMDKELTLAVNYSRSVNIQMATKYNDEVSIVSTNDAGLEEMLNNDEYLNKQYDILAGDKIAAEYNELSLVVDKYNRLSIDVLNALKVGYEKGKEFVDFQELLGKEFRLLLNDNYYVKDLNGVFSVTDDLSSAYDSGVTLKIVSVLRIKEDSNSTIGYHGLVYNSKLTDYVLENNKMSEIAIEQSKEENKTIDVTTGKVFVKAFNHPITDEKELSEALEIQLKKLGAISTPASISIYPKDFESKNKIKEYLDAWNIGKEEEEQIIYNDLASVAMSMMDEMIKMVSYVLIAFSAISLVVSSIMIGIITYVSVIERTKEIGVLRSLGSRKKDVSRVFNAETLMIGFLSGIIGILLTVILNIPINSLIFKLVGVGNIANLKWSAGLILVAISMGLTFIAGLIPSRIAAKKDPVIALRTE